MITVLALYIGFLLLLAWHYARKGGDYRDFVTAGGRQGGGLVMLSMLATMVGGSATLGMADMAARMGWPAFWWLGVGAIGLAAQAWLLSDKVRGMDACTLPELAAITVGEHARVAVGLLIVIAWTGVIAAQLVALSQVIAAMTGLADTRLLLVLFSAGVAAYTAAGGQLSVLRTDRAQFALIVAGVGGAAVFLYAGPAELPPVEWLNARFDGADWVRLLLVVGSTFFIGPDIFSRAFAAKDGATARRATLGAALGLAFFGAVITLVGMAASGLAGPDNKGVLPALIRSALPLPVAALLGVGLVSALVSSADTCLMSAAAIVENDLVRSRRGRSRTRVRVFVLVIGAVSLGIALFRGDVIHLLLTAYSMYAPGVTPPLFLAIMSHGRRAPHPGLWLAAVGTGGAFGLWGAITSLYAPPLIGMAASALLGAASLYWGRPARGSAAKPA